MTQEQMEGEVEQHFFVPIVEDLDVEPVETVSLRLSRPQGGAKLGLQPAATLNIISAALSSVLRSRKLERRAEVIRQDLDKASEIQRSILENLYVVPVFRHAGVAAIGPRIAAQKWQDVFPTITTAYAFPWEDIKLKE